MSMTTVSAIDFPMKNQKLQNLKEYEGKLLDYNDFINKEL